MKLQQLLWTLLLMSLALSGCVAGKTTMILAPYTARYTCGNVTVQPDSFYSDGFAVLYYIIPLFPMFNFSETKSYLELPIIVQSAIEPVFDLTLQDVSVRVPNATETIQPTKVKILTENVIPNKPWYSKTFKFTFPVNRHSIDQFELVFPKPLHGCDIPDTLYVKKQETSFGTPLL